MKGLLTIGALLLTGFCSAQDKEDFTYKVESDINDDVQFLRFDIIPVQASMMGSYVSLGVGAQAQASDIAETFSVRGRFDYNFLNFTTNKNKLLLVTESYEELKTTALDVNIGYTIKKESVNETQNVRLRHSGNTEVVSDLPARAVYRYQLRAGFNSVKVLSRSEISYRDSMPDDFGNMFLSESTGELHLTQSVRSIVLGYEKRTSVNTVYQTDKYGVVTHSTENSFYVDALIGLGGNIPELFRTVYSNPSYPNRITSLESPSETGIEDLESKIKYLPVGIRCGLSAGDRHRNYFGFTLDATLYPGLYTKMSSLIQVRAGLTFRLIKT